MLEDFSGIVEIAHRHQRLSPPCLVGNGVNPKEIHDFDGRIEEQALRFLANCSINQWWFWYVVEQVAFHAIGPRIQLAHVVDAICRLRRLRQDDLLSVDVETLNREELGKAIAMGTVLLGNEKGYPVFVPNPIFKATFDPVQVAVSLR